MFAFLASGMNSTQICVIEKTEVSAFGLICQWEQGLIMLRVLGLPAELRMGASARTGHFLPRKHGRMVACPVV